LIVLTLFMVALVYNLFGCPYMVAPALYHVLTLLL
jgi:hypothetical protein